MSGNAQQKLVKMLAESRLRIASAKQAKQRMMANLPNTEQQMRSRLEELRNQIQEQGIGADEGAEDEYIELLEQLDRIESLSTMQGAEPVSGELRKSLDYGRCLASYGSLISAASPQMRGDLIRWAEHFSGIENPEAQRLAIELRREADASWTDTERRC